MRTNTFKVDRVEKTPEGFLIIDCKFSRVGIQKYSDGVYYRPAEEVFNKDSLKSFIGKAVTFFHPDEQVTSTNWKNHEVGTILTFEKADDESTGGKIVVKDQNAIEYIQDRQSSGKDVQLSCGYFTEDIKEDGEYNGEKYDYIQTKIRGNHVAICLEGRAGNKIKMLMDSKEKRMKFKIKLDAFGKLPEINIDSEDANEIIEVAKKRVDDMKKVVDSKDEELEKVKAKKDSFEAEAKKLKEDNEKLISSENPVVKDMVEKRVKLDAVCKALGIAQDGKTDSELREAVIKDSYPDFDSKDKSEAYISARFDCACDNVKDKINKDSAKTLDPKEKKDDGDMEAGYRKKLNGGE